MNSSYIRSTFHRLQLSWNPQDTPRFVDFVRGQEGFYYTQVHVGQIAITTGNSNFISAIVADDMLMQTDPALAVFHNQLHCWIHLIN